LKPRINFFFVQPRFSLSVADTEYILTFAGLFVVGLVISSLAARSREQAEAARRREVQAVVLYELSRDLASTTDLDDILNIVVRHVGETFSRKAVILLRAGDAVEQRARHPGFELDENELAVAAWVLRQGLPAGRRTDTLPAAAARYIPLKTARGVVGVLGVRAVDPDSCLTPEPGGQFAGHDAHRGRRAAHEPGTL
jgi:two-component system sensor histidine kinase KdpD